MTLVSLLLFQSLLSANFFLIPVRGSLSWTLFLFLSYVLLLLYNPKIAFQYPPQYIKIISFAILLFTLLFLVSGNIFLLKYLFLIGFTSFLSLPVASYLCRASFLRYRSIYCLFLFVLITLFLVNFFFPSFLASVSTRFVSPYYGIVPRFSGLNGEPGPNAYAIISCLCILKYIAFAFNPKCRSFSFPPILLVSSLVLYSMTLSIASFFYFLAALSLSYLLTALLRVAISSRIKITNKLNFFRTKKNVFTGFLVLLFISFGLVVFSIYSGLSDGLISKLLQTYYALINFDFAMIPSRGFIFEKFATDYTSTLFDYSLFFLLLLLMSTRMFLCFSM